MKYKNENKKLNIRCEIEEDEGIGFYLYVYDMADGRCIKDHLQDTLEIAKEQAKEEYGMLDENWIQENSDSQTHKD